MQRVSYEHGLLKPIIKAEAGVSVLYYVSKYNRFTIFNLQVKLVYLKNILHFRGDWPIFTEARAPTPRKKADTQTYKLPKVEF